ncbi:hypothetical protein MKX01_036645 [Papaver californicum]|nr:hypothetical protein MKX01_036645 [Papaver californicum]
MASFLPSSLAFQPKQNPNLTKPRINSSISSSLSNSAEKWVSNLQSKSLNFALSSALALGLSLSGVGIAEAALSGVSKPELLPKDFSTVIDVAGFLSAGQERQLSRDTGLAIKDYWQVDDRTIVFVADPTFGNILNFNVGAIVDLDIPRSFWSRLAGKYGNMFYWKEKGEDASVEAAVMAISQCLSEPVGPTNCSEVR